MPSKFFILVVALFFATAAQAKDHQLWGALIMAANQPDKKLPPPELIPYQKQMAKVFGYPHFQILGKSTRQFADNTEQWLIPGETFSVRAIVTPADAGNFHVALQLFQAKKELVQTDAKLGPDSPLFIRGPLYGDGQLIIVILVRNHD